MQRTLLCLLRFSDGFDGHEVRCHRDHQHTHSERESFNQYHDLFLSLIGLWTPSERSSGHTCRTLAASGAVFESLNSRKARLSWTGSIVVML
jgi:hypothetical protein